ncbi:MAG: hypothetical protein PF572_02170 [Patescibacteria group bacterium]|jgi:hypothetical protein|nr:hypothetical protein [Patescibacteria group bacterium]
MLNSVQLDNQKDDELKDLIKKNIKLSEDIHEIAIYVKKYIFWSRIFSFFKLFIIIIPIILSIIYLPPLLGQVLDQYKTILNVSSGVNNVPNIESLSPDLLKFIK